MIRIAAQQLAQSLIASVTLLLVSTALPAQPTPTQHYMQTNLVADTPGVAQVTDPNLVNAWGMSRSSTSPWWVSDNGTGLATLYSGTGTTEALVVTIPPADSKSGDTGTPTGQVFNGTNSFQLVKGSTNFPAVFLFVTEDGTLSGWNPKVNATNAVIKVNTHSASVFKGLAIASIDNFSGTPTYYLYAADFRKGEIAVYDTNFYPVQLRRHAFEDERIPRGFAPFNIQNIGGNLYVAYAQQDSEKHDEVDGAGLGFVDVFSPRGRLLNRLEYGSWFNAPWGLTQAPSDFGEFSHHVLVGQFGSGQILAFDPVTGRFKGWLYDASNAPITIDGLWGLSFGSGAPNATSAPANSLFFTAGPDGEQHGLFGTITAVENVLGGDL
jgi:uncharacterized protein (TIGR03118 family)